VIPCLPSIIRYFVSLPVIAACLSVVFASVWIILELQQWWDGVIKENGYANFFREEEDGMGQILAWNHL
jgi:hypothetical protein